MYDDKGIAKIGDFGSAEKFEGTDDMISKTGGTY